MSVDSQRKMLGPFLLILVSLLWGTSFPLIKTAVSSIDAGQYVTLRFLLSAIILAPYFSYGLIKNKILSLKAARAGTILGILYFGGIFLQGLGTEYTSASNSGFITSLYIPLVYTIDVLYYRLNYSHKFTLALALSIAGMYLVSGGSYESRMGDLLVLAGAFFWALQVMAVDKFSKKYSPIDLVFLQYALTALLGFALTPTLFANVEVFSKVFAVLLYLAVVCSVLVGLLQVIGQKYTAASKAVLIYALEPVSAALFSFLILGESLGFSESIGATLILVSVIISLWEMTNRKKR